MAKIYNSVNEAQSQSGLLARNLYTSEQIEYKLRQKADKTQVYTKLEVDNKFITLTSIISNVENDFNGFSFQLNQPSTINKPLKWNGVAFVSCLNSLAYDGISPTPLGWNNSTNSLVSLFPSLDSGSERNSSNNGLFLGRQTIIQGGVFNSDPLSVQKDPLSSLDSPEVYLNSGLNWNQFEPNNRLITKHSIASNNNSLGANSLYTGELAININTGDIFIGWEGKTLSPQSNVYLDGIKTLFSPSLYIKKSPSLEQIIQASNNISSLIVKGNSSPLGDENARADIAQFYTKDGYKKTFINAVGDLNTQILNINQTPLNIGSSSPQYKIPIKVMGQTYYILLSAN